MDFRRSISACGLLTSLFAWSLIAVAEGSQAQASAPAESFSASFEVAGGAHRMFRDQIDQPTLMIGAWSLNGAEHEVSVKFQIEDVFGKPIKSRMIFKSPCRPMAEESRGQSYFNPGLDILALRPSSRAGIRKSRRWTDLGIVYPPFKGVRPNSLFGSNTSGLKQGVDLEFLQTIGMKVERAHFAPPVQARHPYWPLEFPRGAAVPLDFSKLDKNWEQTKSHDIWALPIVGYSLAGAGNIDRTPLAESWGCTGRRATQGVLSPPGRGFCGAIRKSRPMSFGTNHGFLNGPGRAPRLTIAACKRIGVPWRSGLTRKTRSLRAIAPCLSGTISSPTRSVGAVS